MFSLKRRMCIQGGCTWPSPAHWMMSFRTLNFEQETQGSWEHFRNLQRSHWTRIFFYLSFESITAAYILKLLHSQPIQSACFFSLILFHHQFRSSKLIFVPLNYGSHTCPYSDVVYHCQTRTITKTAFGGTFITYPIPNSALLLLSILTLVSLDRLYIFPTLTPLLSLIWK